MRKTELDEGIFANWKCQVQASCEGIGLQLFFYEGYTKWGKLTRDRHGGLRLARPSLGICRSSPHPPAQALKRHIVPPKRLRVKTTRQS